MPENLDVAVEELEKGVASIRAELEQTRPLGELLREHLEQRVGKTEEALAALQSEVAQNRPVGDLIRYLLYFWTAITIVLGPVRVEAIRRYRQDRK